MDIVSNIEEQLKTVLEGISNNSIGDYTQYTKTGVVNIEDEILSRVESDSITDINYMIVEEDEETNTSFQIGQNALSNVIPLKIIARVKNATDESFPRRAIKRRMNEVLTDVKQSLYMNFTLNNSCDYVEYKRSRKEIFNSNRIYTGDLIIDIIVRYSQSGKNPNMIACI
ncbi:MAG: hypothetical protein K9L56_15010 [Clostridiales bacterium]|nr:hypothetical protein [Clostridiales bacterium]